MSQTNQSAKDTAATQDRWQPGHARWRDVSAHAQTRVEERRLFSSTTLAALEYERQRIAIGLHDEAAQMLAVAQLRLGELARYAADPVQKSLLDEARALLVRTAASIRTTVFDLGAGLAAYGCLDDAVRRLTSWMSQTEPFTLQLHLRGPAQPLDPATTAALLRLVRELLVNTHKHSGAVNSWVTTSHNGRHVTVSVADDGCGFDPVAALNSVNSTGGFGLFSLAAQIKALGGSLDIRSAPGTGTRVAASFPLRFAFTGTSAAQTFGRG